MTSALTAQRFDRSLEDIGNLVEFGHLNIRVPDQRLAIAFYVSGLGLTRDPYLHTGVGNAWINVGRSQFHLPVGPPQVLRGTVHLLLPDLPALERRLADVAPLLDGSRFSYHVGGDRIDVVCPWGNRICVRGPDPARFGRRRLGMPCIEVDVAPGRAAGIARFYSEVLGSPAANGRDADGVFAHIPVGAGESLRFREVDRELPACDGHHVQVTVADFSGVHRRLLERGLISEESSQSQYRFVDIVDPATGEPLAQLEHEVRSMRHPLYARVLVNRDPSIGTRNFGERDEAMHWQAPAD